MLSKNIRIQQQSSASMHSLTEIAKEEIIKDPCLPDDDLSLVDRCVVTMRKQLKTTHKEQKELLQNFSTPGVRFGVHSC